MKKLTLKQGASYAHKYATDTNSYTFQGTYASIQVTSDPSNCKLSYINNIGIIGNFGDNIKKEVINDLLSICKGCVIFNTTNKAVAKFISKNYETYYYNLVPIGYNSGFQHHICIRNLIKKNEACRKPSNGDKTTLDLDTIATKLRIILRNKRRKDDYITEFINSLK